MKKNNLYEISYELKKKLQLKILKIAIHFILICSFIILVLSFVFFTVQNKSTSMEPTISSNSCIFVSPLNKKISRGDLVLLNTKNISQKSVFSKVINLVIEFFTAQKYSLIKGEETSSTIRRIVGLPGDTIYMNDYILYIKPKDQSHYLTEFEYMDKKYEVLISTLNANWDLSLGSVGKFETIVLKNNEFFVLADNRNDAIDSRLWGAIDQKKIMGKALFQYFPFNSLKIL